MDESIKESSLNCINRLVGKKLQYAIKSPDTELYDLGFGKLINATNLHGHKKMVGEYTIHVLCNIRVIWQTERRKVHDYYGNTSQEAFNSRIRRLLGMEVLRVGLSEKNDLYLDLGCCWIVFVTLENNAESWRFFSSNREMPHLVASDAWLEMVY